MAIIPNIAQAQAWNGYEGQHCAAMTIATTRESGEPADGVFRPCPTSSILADAGFSDITCTHVEAIRSGGGMSPTRPGSSPVGARSTITWSELIPKRRLVHGRHSRPHWPRSPSPEPSVCAARRGWSPPQPSLLGSRTARLSRQHAGRDDDLAARMADVVEAIGLRRPQPAVGFGRGSVGGVLDPGT